MFSKFSSHKFKNPKKNSYKTQMGIKRSNKCILILVIQSESVSGCVSFFSQHFHLILKEI